LDKFNTPSRTKVLSLCSYTSSATNPYAAALERQQNPLGLFDQAEVLIRLLLVVAVSSFETLRSFHAL